MNDSWMAATRLGNFAAAWRESDRELAAIVEDEWRKPRHLQRTWRGTPLRGRRVLVRCYHGLGDSVQFLRYLPRVAEVAGEVTLWLQPALIPLIGELGVQRVLPLHDGTPDAEWDVDVEIMELPYVFRTTLETIPRHVPYLTVPRELARRRSSEIFRVGLAWRAGDWDHERSYPVDLAHQLVDGLPCEVHVLQEWLWPHERMHFRPLDTARLDETAALIDSLDLVITIDSLYAHLAGALGVATWVLLKDAPDWRWMTGREDSPWYPTLRLFRQSLAGDWQPVLRRVREELERELERISPARVRTSASNARRRA